MNHNYEQGNYWTRNRSISGDSRTSFRGRGRYEQNYRQNYSQNKRGQQYTDSYRNDLRRGPFRETQNYRDHNYRSGCRQLQRQLHK